MGGGGESRRRGGGEGEARVRGMKRTGEREVGAIRGGGIRDRLSTEERGW